jgi:hypothetical protein
VGAVGVCLTQVFKYSLFLVLCNRITSCAVAVFMLVVRRAAVTFGESAVAELKQGDGC